MALKLLLIYNYLAALFLTTPKILPCWCSPPSCAAELRTKEVFPLMNTLDSNELMPPAGTRVFIWRHRTLGYHANHYHSPGASSMYTVTTHGWQAYCADKHLAADLINAIHRETSKRRGETRGMHYYHKRSKDACYQESKNVLDEICMTDVDPQLSMYPVPHLLKPHRTIRCKPRQCDCTLV